MDNNSGFKFNVWFILLIIMFCQVYSCTSQRGLVQELREIKQELRK